MPVELANDLFWINECQDIGDRHMHVSTYVIKGDTDNILIDTGSFRHSDDIISQIRTCTDGDGIDVLLLSHPDLPHSGNVESLRSEWPDLELVLFSNTPALHGFPGATRGERGTDQQIGDRQFSWIDAPILDVTSTAWVYDHTTRTLFTADGLGHYHPANACSKRSEEISDGIAYDDVYSFHKDVVPWLKYVEPQRLFDKLDYRIGDRKVERIAPVHGNPVSSTDIEQYREKFERAIEEIAADYRFPPQ
jgi:flavorubredoxin